MIPDEADYPFAVTLSTPLNGWEEWFDMARWARSNKIALSMSFGKICFKEEQDAILFRLVHGL